MQRWHLAEQGGQSPAARTVRSVIVAGGHHLVSTARAGGSRALRFAAAATAGVLAIVLLTIEVVRPLALGLLASQAAMFAFTAFVSVHWSVFAQFFARVIWPRIGAAPALEDARPARFAQFIGFVLTVVGLLGFIIGMDVVGYSLTAIAAAGSVVRATTGLCVGCTLYVLVRRLQHARARA